MLVKMPMDDLLQACHFAGFGDARFDDGHAVVGRHLPHRQRNANLRVVAFGAGGEAAVGRKQLHEPVFDDGLAIAACDAYHGDGKLAAVLSGNGLQGCHHVVDMPDVGFWAVDMAVGRHDEVAYTAEAEAFDISATGVAFGGDGKEEGPFGRAQFAAVGKEGGDFVVGEGQGGVDGVQQGV